MYKKNKKMREKKKKSSFFFIRDKSTGTVDQLVYALRLDMKMAIYES